MEAHSLEHVESFADDEHKEIELIQVRLQEQGKCFSSKPEWAAELAAVAECRVLKMPKLLLALMYLLGVSREQVCVPHSNYFSWKIAKPIFLQ